MRDYCVIAGTFLYDCDKERYDNNLRTRTVSLWSVLLDEDGNGDGVSMYTNPLYVFTPDLLQPSTSARQLDLWRSYHLRHSGHAQPTHSAQLRERAIELINQMRQLKAEVTESHYGKLLSAEES